MKAMADSVVRLSPYRASGTIGAAQNNQETNEIEHELETAHHLQKLSYSATTINCDLRALKRILNVAWRSQTRRGILRHRTTFWSHQRDFVLCEQDELEYLAACEPLQRDVAIHMLDMSLRPEEIHQLS